MTSAWAVTACSPKWVFFQVFVHAFIHERASTFVGIASTCSVQNSWLGDPCTFVCNSIAFVLTIPRVLPSQIGSYTWLCTQMGRTSHSLLCLNIDPVMLLWTAINKVPFLNLWLSELTASTVDVQQQMEPPVITSGHTQHYKWQGQYKACTTAWWWTKLHLVLKA